MQTIRNLCTQPLWRVLIAFLFFSIADFFLTWKLIERDSSEVIESNPMAALVLGSCGWFGLAGYKLALVLTFFTLATVVERRRPMGGLLLLVFACGVHAAVVTSSAFMYFENAQSEMLSEASSESLMHERLSLPIGATALLNQKIVQVELNLSEEQIFQVVQATKKRRELSRELANGHLDSCQSKLLLLHALEHSLIHDLTQAQFSRIAQLALQKRGVLALGDGDVAGTLEFTEEQRAAIDSIVEKLPPSAKAPLRRPTDMDPSSKELDGKLSEVKTQLLSVLTESQKTRWNAMLGVPFCFQTGKALAVTAAME